MATKHILTDTQFEHLSSLFEEREDLKGQFAKANDFLYKARFCLKLFDTYSNATFTEDRCRVTSLDKTDIRIVYRRVPEHFQIDGETATRNQFCERIHDTKKLVRSLNSKLDKTQNKLQAEVSFIAKASGEFSWKIWDELRSNYINKKKIEKQQKAVEDAEKNLKELKDVLDSLKRSVI